MNRAFLARLTSLAASIGAAAPSTAQFGPPEMFGAGTFGWGSCIASGDLDGDGDLDVVLADYQTARELVWSENVEGALAPPQLLGAPIAVLSLEIVDLDGDGDNDLLCACKEDGVGWYENLGGAIFGPRQTVAPSVDVAFCVRPGDMNEDGWIDLVVAGTIAGQGNVIAWHRNLQGQGFGLPVALSSATLGPNDLDVVDIDGDDDLDVLFTSQGDGAVGWFEGGGDGSFSATKSISTSPKAVHLIHADIDVDGDLDVVVSNYLSNDWAWYENLGGGVFDTGHAMATGTWPSEVAASDVDGDGDEDLLFVDQYDYEVLLLENLGGTFAATQEVSDDFFVAFTCALADLDGDADADLIVTDQVGVHRLENQYELGSTTCAGQPNSTGLGAEASATGSTVVAKNAFALGARQLPPNQFGYFLASETQGFVQNPGGSQGNLCLGGTIGRFVAQLQQSGAAGTFLIPVDLTDMPGPAQKSVLPGETWSFQSWYRDKNPTQTSNFTSAVAVLFR